MNKTSRLYRNNVFCLLYEDRKNLLSLYNAVNKTNYADENELTIVTLDMAFCVKMKNDAAFVIDGRLSLYEQQSTVNPNMPLRDLYYVAEELKSLLPLTELYRRKPVKIPLPKFVTFYNGETEQPAITELRLSDLYEQKTENPELELVVQQINISEGYNEDILKQCESLMGYMRFVNKVRGKKAAGMVTRDAVTEAVDECIREDILADFFREHKSEVIDMGIYEFDEEAYERIRREECEQEGLEKGLARGLAQGLAQGLEKGLAQGLEKGLAQGLEEGRTQGLEEGRAQGLAEGLAQGKGEDILELLEDLGTVPEELRGEILQQRDPAILKKWHKLSARVNSVEEFVKNLPQHST